MKTQVASFQTSVLKQNFCVQLYDSPPKNGVVAYRVVYILESKNVYNCKT